MMMKNVEKAKGQRLARHPAAEAAPRFFPFGSLIRKRLLARLTAWEIAFAPAAPRSQAAFLDRKPRTGGNS
jgi:hypothetical protein